MTSPAQGPWRLPRRWWAAVALLLAVAVASRTQPEPPAPAAAYEWQLPKGFPVPLVPASSPVTAARVELGRYLFYDPRLSTTGTYSCASCHRQELAFTDGRARAVGATGQEHPRSAMSLANVAYNATLGWDEPHLHRLEHQARVPMFNEHPVELGLAGHEDEVLARLQADQHYRRLFAAAFPNQPGPLSLQQVLEALASFERTLISGDSAFDRWLYGQDPSVLSASARRGLALFFSERLGCAGCHRGFNFSGPVVYEGAPAPEAEFHNTGLYNLDGQGAYPPDNPGLLRFTHEPADMGRFRAPTLRNIALTAPYMHDGSLPTLDAVLDHYASGGRTDSPLKDPALRGFHLSSEERQDLIHFLESLTDQGFVSDPRFGDPFRAETVERVGADRR